MVTFPKAHTSSSSYSPPPASGLPGPHDLHNSRVALTPSLSPCLCRGIVWAEAAHGHVQEPCLSQSCTAIPSCLAVTGETSQSHIAERLQAGGDPPSCAWQLQVCGGPNELVCKA